MRWPRGRREGGQRGAKTLPDACTAGGGQRAAGGRRSPPPGGRPPLLFFFFTPGFERRPKAVSRSQNGRTQLAAGVASLSGGQRAARERRWSDRPYHIGCTRSRGPQGALGRVPGRRAGRCQAAGAGASAARIRGERLTAMGAICVKPSVAGLDVKPPAEGNDQKASSMAESTVVTPLAGSAGHWSPFAGSPTAWAGSPTGHVTRTSSLRQVRTACHAREPSGRRGTPCGAHRPRRRSGAPLAALSPPSAAQRARQSWPEPGARAAGPFAGVGRGQRGCARAARQGVRREAYRLRLAARTPGAGPAIGVPQRGGRKTREPERLVSELTRACGGRLLAHPVELSARRVPHHYGFDASVDVWQGHGSRSGDCGCAAQREAAAYERRALDVGHQERQRQY